MQLDTKSKEGGCMIQCMPFKYRCALNCISSQVNMVGANVEGGTDNKEHFFH